MAKKTKYTAMRAWILSAAVAGVVGGTTYFAAAATNQSSSLAAIGTSTTTAGVASANSKPTVARVAPKAKRSRSS